MVQTKRSVLKTAGQVLLFVVVCELAGLLGALTTATGGSAWYEQLAKPSFNPPSWLFGPVWTLLYALMGVAAYLVWRQGSHRHDVRVALGFFIAQLVLNAVWTPVFFGAHSLAGGMAVIGLLWLLIVATMQLFFPIERTSGWLLVPYLAWVSFAAILNGTIWYLNAGGA